MKIATFSRKIDARRAPNQRKTRARSAGVHRASFGTIGAVSKRIRRAFCARSAPRKHFLARKIAAFSRNFDHSWPVTCFAVSCQHDTCHDTMAGRPCRIVVSSCLDVPDVISQKHGQWMRSEGLFLFLRIFINVFINDTRRRKASFHRLVFRVV